MKRINVLNKHIAQLIAAGEVVERPSSVLKELLENSIDSGATKITVEIKNGGVKLIKVSDNGSGIYKDDVKNAFLRHATSKLKAADDLNNINSLGFRGEALASICAVSKTEVITKTKDEFEGTHYYINGGIPGIFEDIGCSDGTTIIVRDLFYNTPARMKFLKKDVSEANFCAGVIDKIALSHPEISFKFIREGKVVLNTPGDSKISSAIYCVYGKEFFKGMIPVKYELNHVKITGFISKPTFAKSTRTMQNFFINGRYIKSKLGTCALEEAFKNSIMVGKFPYCVIYIEIAPELVDVNVHPSKTEVKFLNEKDIFEAIYYGARSALMAEDKSKFSGFEVYNKPSSNGFSNPLVLKDSFKNMDFGSLMKNNNFKPDQNTVKDIPDNSFKTLNSACETQNYFDKKTLMTEKNSYEKIENPETNNLSGVSKLNSETIKPNFEKSVLNTSPILPLSTLQENTIEKESNDLSLPQSSEKRNIKIIGEIFKCYILVECDEELVLVDKHAAHERIIFENLKNNENNNDNSQLLIEPKVVSLEKNEYNAVIENLELFSKAGFSVENFGMGTVIVRSVPMYITPEEISDSILEMAEHMANNQKNTDTKKLDWFYHNIACRAAVKGGKNSSKEEITVLINRLIQNPEIKYCPHGRPIFISFSKKFIEKQFGRI